MEEIVKELQELLDKHNLTIDDAIRIYNEHNKKEKKRKVQRYPDTGGVWCYCDTQEKNPCGCGSNCYHYEYDKTDKKIYGVCNCCNTDIYELKDEFVPDKLKTGVWN